MSLTYTRASRFPRSERGGDLDASSSSAVVTPPTIDLTATDTSLLLRCDHPATVSVFVSGNPFPVVTWFVGSRRIQEDEDSSEFRVSGGGAEDAGGRKRVLSIARVTADLEDGIRLEAVNCAGTDRIRINVKTYKFLTGRSTSELTRSATLPPSLLRHRFQAENSKREEFREVKTMVKDKSQNRFQTTEEDYENWKKEMENRSHMRSIDDIIDNLSDDEEEETDENPEKESRTKSCDDVFPPTTMNKTQPLPPPPPPPALPAPLSKSTNVNQSPTAPLNAAPEHRSVAPNPQQPKSVEVVTSSESRTVPECDSASSLPDCYVKMVYKDSTSKANDKYCGPHDAPIWDMCGVKLSEFCKNILSVNGRCRKEDGFPQITREFEENCSPSCRIQVCSVPVERKYLGTPSAKSQVMRSFLADPETAKKQQPRFEKDFARGGVGDDDPRPNRPRETKTGPGVTRPPTARPPLAPKPSFSEVRVANRVASSRPFSAETVKRSTSLPRGSAATDDVARDLIQPKIVDMVSIENNAAFAARPPRLDLTAPISKDSSEGKKNTNPAEKSPSSRVGSIPDAQKSNANIPKTTEVEETHFDSSPDDVRKYKIPQKNARAENSRTVGDTETKSSGEQVSKGHRESVGRKPPVAKDKPFWRPGVSGERISRPNAPMILIERQTKNSGFSPTTPLEKPLIPVRRVKSQSSGKTDEGASDFAGLVAGSTSARQLSQCQEPDGYGEQLEEEDCGGKIQLSAAIRSEGLLTARKLTLLPPSSPSGHGERRDWRSCVLPPSRSVDVLDSSKSLYGTPKIGRRSLSKEWNVVTVTTKEEIVILRRPRQEGAVIPAVTPSSSSSSANPENKVTWKLPLGPGRPFAV